MSKSWNPLIIFLSFCGLVLLPHAARAQTHFAGSPVGIVASHASYNGADIAWMLVASALVMLMTPAIALFYSGLVRSKNALSVLMMSFVASGVVTVQWVIFGYSLAFGPDHHGLHGDFAWSFLRHVGFLPSPLAPTIPHLLFMVFQMMFATMTAAIIGGAVAERMKFGSYLLFMLLWTTIVYDPLAHWVWSGSGWLHQMGFLDFAGGTVVHISSGVSALVLALMIGKRRRTASGDELRPHSLPLTLAGTALLWFGWFGFNAGSAEHANLLAVSAFVNTHIATGTAAITWMLLEWRFYKRPTALGFASGAVAGLVAITPACGYVLPFAALIIGFTVAIVAFFAIRLKTLVGADDALDVFGIHACSGIWGALATGIFATRMVNSAAENGLLYGNPAQLRIQLIGIVATVALAAVGSYLIGLLVRKLCGLRSSDREEDQGIDIAALGEEAYSGKGGGTVFAPNYSTSD
jgi:Amt family ammonium transporter